MNSPLVSFVVPCYKLAHLLSECVQSILRQTHKNLEILIMDDCSPDNTPEVARSFTDPRVKHIRNDPNLGHLRNYNKGIAMSAGKYVWLISADDFLGEDYVLEKYVSLMEKHSDVGYVFCASRVVGNEKDSKRQDWVEATRAIHGEEDRILTGDELLEKLVYGNSIVAPTGLVRKECYDKLGAFPLDMPWAGDWYLWCLFALYYKVGYFAEAMVCYREHGLSMTEQLWKKDVKKCCEEDVSIPWVIKKKADALGKTSVSSECLRALARIYVRSLGSVRYQMSRPSLELTDFEESLQQNTSNPNEQKVIRAHVFAGLGSEKYWQGDLGRARDYYSRALRIDPWMMDVRVKKLLSNLGPMGQRIWKAVKN